VKLDIQTHKKFLNSAPTGDTALQHKIAEGKKKLRSLIGINADCRAGP
jgi:hypothetical protein